MNEIKRFGPAALCLVLLHLAASVSARASLATVWHIPDDNTDLGFDMRNPEFEIGTNTTINYYTGLWKWNNGVQIANQTGGWLIYKGALQSSWSSNALSWVTNTAVNQYWMASNNSSAFQVDDVIQYYFLLTFDGSDGVTNTCLYGGDGFSLTTGSAAVAAASPFTIRNRPAWLYHDGNRVVTANTNGTTSAVSYWMEIGYQGKDGTVGSRWANNACVYYTIDGSTPAGALGVGSGTTLVAPMVYDHEQDNSSIAGNAMWWVATVSNTPNFTPINYVIGVWNSANDEEKFADYQAAVNDTIFSFTDGALGDPVLTVNGVNADYTIEHLFVDEVAGGSIPVTVLFSPNATNVVEADVFSNLNRRNRAVMDANGDGVEDGILPPDGNLIPTGNDENYYKAYAMSPTGTPGQYALTLYATNCGAYRLTARYQLAGNTNWYWYSSEGSVWRGDTAGRRDHAIVVSPVKARNLTLYELDALNLTAQSTNESDRGTFANLYNGPGSRPYDPVTNRFNIAYLQNLGVNCLWLQPIHPIGILNRLTDSDTGLPYTVGSPYSVKNFFQINPLLGAANTRAEAMQEFTNFVVAADAAGISVMLDEPFSDAAWDLELDVAGTNYFAPTAQPTNEIADSQPLFFSRTNEYDQRALSAPDVAVAPDRFDFGKWLDTAHIYSGRYAALVSNEAQSTNYLSEADWFDYSIGQENGSGAGNGHFDPVTQNVWRYYSDYLLYWLTQTGCPSNTPPSLTSSRGIGGLRADFGQGLSPQCWEYIINKVRCQKWDFVFMGEVLDGGVVTYRACRTFDVLEENLLFDLQSAAVASDYRNAFDERRDDYGQSLVLMNNTSHDEDAYADPYEALIRYMACDTIDGLPMIFYGEELGIATDFGFDQYQVNSSGQTVPQIMVFNDLQPICHNQTFGLAQLYPVYAAVNQARQFSPALRSPNRYYLNQLGSEVPQASIFSVAKYETANGAPNFDDVVFAFTTLDRNDPQSGVFDVNITQNGSNLFGIQPGRIYNVKNISAYLGADANRRNYWLWPTNGSGGIAGSNVLANGVYVSLNPVPNSNAGWTNAPFEAQYLKLYDVTPPATLAAPVTGSSYVLTNTVTFAWAALNDPTGGVSGYWVIVGTTPGGSNIFSGMVTGTSLTVSGAYGATLYAEVSAVNNAGIQGPASLSSAGTVLVNPAWIPLVNLSQGGRLSWNSVSGLTYQVWSTTNLSVPFTVYGGVVTASDSTMSYANNPTNAARYFKVQLFP